MERPTKNQIQKLSEDRRLLKAFEGLVNAKLEQWQASLEFEAQAKHSFDTLERRLSGFCVVAGRPYKGAKKDLKQFLQDLADDEKLGFFHVLKARR